MEKSKLGISIALFGALLFFIGAAGNVFTVIIAAGYVLLFEESKTLKRMAVKALLLTVCIAIIQTLLMFAINWLSSLFNSLSSYSSYLALNVNFNGNYSYSYFHQFLQYILQNIDTVTRIILTLIPVMYGFRAYRQKEIKIKWIDKILDAHFNNL